MKFRTSRLLAATAAVCAGMLGSGAALAQGTFTPGSGTTTNCNVGADGTTVDSKSCTVGSVTANMTAWGYTNATLGTSLQAGFTQGRLADWNTGGFGAYTGSREPTSNQHGFDNVTSGCASSTVAVGGSVPLSTNNGGCGGSIEALLMDFGSSKVNLTSVGIGWSSGDADLSVWAWTGGTTPTAMTSQQAKGSTTTSTTLASGTTTAAMTGWTLVSNHDMDLYSPQSTNGTLYSSYFMITTYFGASGGNFDAGNDRFKLNQFTVGLCAGTLTGGTGGNGATCTPTTKVSEPGTLSLAGLAVAGIWAARRRRNG